MALIAALAVGLSASSWMYLRAERAQTRAEASAAQERAVTRFLTDDLLSSANPLLAGNPDIKVKGRTRHRLGQARPEFSDGGLDRAAIEMALGQVYSGLADPKHAEMLLKAALQRRRAALGDGAPETQAVRIALVDLYERDVNNDGMRRIGADILAAGSETSPPGCMPAMSCRSPDATPRRARSA